jgi:hypothetical protein
MEDLSADGTFFKLRIHKNAYKFIGHPALGTLAKKLCSRWKQGYLSMKIDQSWKTVIEKILLHCSKFCRFVVRMNIQENDMLEIPGEFGN